MKNVCKDNKLREFYFKLLHRIVVTKKELFLFGKAEDTKCPYCGMNDSIIHTYLYNQKLIHGELSVNEFIVNLRHKYTFEKFFE